MTLSQIPATYDEQYQRLTDENTYAKRQPEGDGIGSIETFSGLKYVFENPDPASVTLIDIAHALSNMCRFAGHVSRFYSVAEHCVRASEVTEEWNRGGFVTTPAALMHDAHEAYVWDCPRPLKPLLGDVFSDLAAKADAVICDALLRNVCGVCILPADFHLPDIKAADNCLLVAEGMELMTYGPRNWAKFRPDEVEPYPTSLMPPQTFGWEPHRAQEEFLRRAKELGL